MFTVGKDAYLLSYSIWWEDWYHCDTNMRAVHMYSFDKKTRAPVTSLKYI